MPTGYCPSRPENVGDDNGFDSKNYKNALVFLNVFYPDKTGFKAIKS